MNIGTKLICEENFLSLEKDATYFFLRRVKNSIVLVRYVKQTAYILRIESPAFENARDIGVLKLATHQRYLPPWLEKLADLNLDLASIDQRRPESAKILHKDRINDRLQILSELNRNAVEILDSPQLEILIRDYAKKHRPEQNPQRLRTWFLTYHLFGENPWSLLPPFHNAGRWERLEEDRAVKGGHISLGAPLKSGQKRSKFRISNDMAEKIVDSFRANGKKGDPMTNIYRMSLSTHFHVEVVADAKGNRYFKSKDGSPYPSQNQYFYWVNKRIGKRSVQRGIYGDMELRAHRDPSKGRSTEGLRNALELMECDATYTNEHPRGVTGNHAMPKLCVTRGVCALTGTVVGVGFGFESESSDSYRSMLFCAAVPKSFFCRLFGLSISDREWPSAGLPSRLLFDRGPGAKQSFIDELSKVIPVRQMTPAYSGQSKPNVENSHPKSSTLEGPPTYEVSNLTTIEMTQQIIIDLIKRNQTANIQERLTPEEIMKDVKTPIEYFTYLTECGRTDAHGISIATAVRTFLPTTEVAIRHDGIYWNGIRFTSEELVENTIFRRYAGARKVCTLSAFYLPACTRYIWIELDGKLMEISSKLAHADSEQQQFMSSTELEMVYRNKLEGARVLKEHLDATNMHYASMSEKLFGKNPNTRSFAGAYKPNEEAKSEGKHMGNLF